MPELIANEPGDEGIESEFDSEGRAPLEDTERAFEEGVRVELQRVEACRCEFDIRDSADLEDPGLAVAAAETHEVPGPHVIVQPVGFHRPGSSLACAGGMIGQPDAAFLKDGIHQHIDMATVAGSPFDIFERKTFRYVTAVMEGEKFPEFFAEVIERATVGQTIHFLKLFADADHQEKLHPLKPEGRDLVGIIGKDVSVCGPVKFKRGAHTVPHERDIAFEGAFGYFEERHVAPSRRVSLLLQALIKPTDPFE
jgi:hypothetical protein